MNAFLLRSVLRTKRFLPPAVALRIEALCWKRIWQVELREQQRELGASAAKDLEGSERAVLVEAIASAYPFSSLLEVGCSYGQLFHILAPLFPSVKLLGIDPDSARIEAGRPYLQERKIFNAELRACTLGELHGLPAQSFDLAVSSASLLYLSAEEIRPALSEIIRLSHKGIFFLEQHSEMASAEGEPRDYRNGRYWVRNYRKLLEEFFSADAIELKRVPAPLWSSESWQELATLVSVRL